MKVRVGFVSNSSTSSFLIFGIAYEGDLWEAVKEEWKEKLLAKAKEDDYHNYSDDDDEDEDDEDNENPFDGDDCGLLETLCEIADVGNLYVDHPDGYDATYIGESWDSVGDDQTGKQFKDEVKARINKILNVNDSEFGTHSEAYYG